MPQAKIVHDGEEITIDLPDDYITPEQKKLYVLKAEAEKSVKERLGRHRSELMSDSEFVEAFCREHNIPTKDGRPTVNAEAMIENDDLWRQAAERRGVRLDDKGRPISKEIDLKQYQSTWAEEHVKPLQAKLGEKDGFIEQLLEEKRVSDILSGAQGMIKPRLLKREGSKIPPFVRLIGSDFRYDPEHRYYAVAQGDGFRVSANPTEDRPWMDAAEYIASKANQDGWKDFYLDHRPTDTGYGGSNGSHGIKRTYTRSEIDKMSDEEYAKHRDDILSASSEGRIREG